MKMTIDMLRELGSCETYTSRFRRAFPTTEYPDGVEVTRQVCEDKYELFDWSWASSVMLTNAAQREWNRLISHGNETWDAIQADADRVRDEQREAITAWQAEYEQSGDYPDWDASPDAQRAHQVIADRFNALQVEVDRRRNRETAGAFGQLVANDANHSSALTSALRSEERRREQREQQALTDAEYAVTDARQRIATAEREIEDLKGRTRNARRRITDWTARLPELEAAATQARGEFARRQLERQAAKVVDEQAKLDALRQQVADAEAAASTTADESATVAS